VIEVLAAFFSRNIQHFVLPFMIATTPVAIVGALSGFSTGTKRKLYQQVLILMWIISGAAVGPVLADAGENAIEPRPVLGGS
jgi:hypothetical protein